MPPTITVPPALAALVPHSGPLRPVSVRLDPPTLASLETLAERLGGPHRGVLLRFLIGRGLAAVLLELEPYAPVARERESERAHAEATVGGYTEARAEIAQEFISGQWGVELP